MSLKALELKIVSMTNMKKITSSMKMVAAAKIADFLMTGIPFSFEVSYQFVLSKLKRIA